MGSGELCTHEPPLVHITVSASVPFHCHYAQAGADCAILPNDVIRECIASRLWAAKDKESLLAMMQTSCEFRLMVSSFISEVEVDDAAAMQPFPRHATAIRTLGLWVAPNEASNWLRAYAVSDPGAAGRLQLLEGVKCTNWAYRAEPDPEDGPALLEAITQLCPNVRRLLVNLNKVDAINLPLVRSLGNHLPHLTELCLDSGDDYEHNLLHNSGMDWAACLPPCLTKFSMPDTRLPPDLILHLLRVPSLLEVEAYGLDGFEAIGDPIEMEACRREACVWMLRYFDLIEIDCRESCECINHRGLMEGLMGSSEVDTVIPLWDIWG